MAAWSRLTSVGVPNFAPQTLLFYSVFWLLVHALGYRFAQVAVLWALVSCSALSMRALLRSIVETRTPESAIAITGCAILYAFNPFSTSYVWWHQLWLELTWATYPFLLSLLIDAISLRRSLPWAAATGALVLLVAAPGYTHILLVPLGIFAIAIGAATLHTAANRVASLKAGATVLLSWGVSLAWWILPSLKFLADFMAEWHAQYHVAPAMLLDYASQYTSIANVVRLVGLPQLHTHINGLPLYPWFVAFEGPLGVLLFSLPLLVVVGTWFGIARGNTALVRAIAAVCSATWVLAIFLMKGAQWPLPVINRALLGLPLGAAWQHPYDKFAQLAVICSCVLTCLAVLRILELGGARRAIPATLLCGFLLVEGWPAYVGAVLTPQQDSIPGGVVVVPQYYRDFSNAYSGSGLLLQLPLRENGETAFSWDRGAQTNNDPVLENFDNGSPVVRMRTGYPYADAALDEASNVLQQYDAPELLSALGFSAVVIQDDWNSTFFPTQPDISYYKNLLQPIYPPRVGALLRSQATSDPLKISTRPFTQSNFTFSAYVNLRDTMHDQRLFEMDNGTQLLWLRPGYLALWSPSEKNMLFTNDLSARSGEWIKVAVGFYSDNAEIAVDESVVARGHFAVPKRAVSLFVGSADKHKRFHGEIADVSWSSDNQLHFAAVNNPVMRARARAARWFLSAPSGAQQQNVGDVVVAGKKSAGLRLPIPQTTLDDSEISFNVSLSNVDREQALLTTDSGAQLRWLTPGYIGLLVPGRGTGSWIHSERLEIKDRQWFQVELLLRNGNVNIAVDGIPVAGGRLAGSVGKVRSLFLGSATAHDAFRGSMAQIAVHTPGLHFDLLSDANVDAVALHYGWKVSRSSRGAPGFTKQRFGEIEAYLTPCPTPLVYAVGDPTFISNGGNVTDILRRHRCLPSAAISGMRPKAWRFAGDVRIARFSSADVSGYDVVLNGRGNYALVLGTSYSPDWSAKSVTGRSTVLQHSVANGYANVFLISSTGSDVIRIRYGSQRIVWAALLAGLLISIATVAVLVTPACRVFWRGRSFATSDSRRRNETA
ncbi:MAG TPA: LamG-like jellyroll fold domain-containing protein [Candidatus Baltobacteraceae bacterium]|nr:LamG-like jellyroll fold domain-containing protein [Candidatus Baltobacteraceae bacterium]